MKFEEALQAMREGKKVRNPSWIEGEFIRIKVVDEDGEDAMFNATVMNCLKKK